MKVKQQSMYVGDWQTIGYSVWWCAQGEDSMDACHEVRDVQEKYFFFIVNLA